MTKALYAEFTVAPGNEVRVAELVAGLTELVRAEPGNLVFEPYTLAENPRSWFVYEVYADDEAFQAHITAPYGAVFNAELNTLIEGDGSRLTWLVAG